MDMLAGMRRKIRSSGHIVIPKAIRDAHDIHPGDPVTFAEDHGDVVMRKAEHPTAAGKRKREEQTR
jgi:AbrB family looped-hinge helix DNA binding protein